ncbi:MAG TPA: hypothetical protein VM925_34665 [Labilithrix sp.]|nr:hypothetical protein [Labilithrix sp.]
MHVERFVIGIAILCAGGCVARSQDSTEHSSGRASAGTLPADSSSARVDGGAVATDASSSTTPSPKHSTCVSVIDIRNGFGGSYVIPRAVNERGQVVGSAPAAGDSSVHAFFWDDGSMVDLGTLGGSESHALAMNDRGEAVGYAALKGGTVATRATLWRNGEIVDLGELGGGFSIAGDINAAGQIVGNSLTTAKETHAFLWENGVLQDLGTLGGNFSSATRINDRGQVLGHSSVPGEVDKHVFLWERGVMTDLGKGDPGEINAQGNVLMGDSPNVYLWRDGARTQIVPFGDAVATGYRDLNDVGQVIGRAQRPGGREFAFFWNDGATTMIGPEDQQGYVTVLALNRSAQVVGFIGQHDQRAFSWKNGELTFLTPENAQSIALAVNARGQILGTSGGAAAHLWETHPCTGGGNGGDAGSGDGDAGTGADSGSGEEHGDTDASTGGGNTW